MFCPWVFSDAGCRLVFEPCLSSNQGCKERLTPFVPDPRDWSAVRIEDYGYTRMQIFNRTHIWLEQLSDDQVGFAFHRIGLPVL